MADLIFSFTTIIFDVLASLISLIVFIIIIIHLYSNQTKKEEKVTFILIANIFIFIFIYGLMVSSFCINTILGELYGYNFESTWCLFSGYFIAVVIFALYSVFVSQAIFRLFRIVYSSHKWLQLFWLYIFAGPVELISGCAILCPVLLWNDVKYLPSEYHCFVPFLRLRGIIWMIGTAYGFPLSAILIIYFRVTMFIHYQSNNQTLIIQRRQVRDLLAIRRILITVSILIIVGFPSVVLLLMAIITGVEQPFTYRIQWITGSISMLGLSTTTVLFTPQLKFIVMKKWQQNRVGNTTNNGGGNNVPLGNVE